MTIVRVNDRWDLAVPEHRVEHWRVNPYWEPARLESMAANLRPGMVLYDIGAEQGDLSALFAKWVTERVRKGDVYVTRDGTGRQVGKPIVQPDEVTRVEGGGMVLVEPGAHYWPTIRETFRLNDLPAPLIAVPGFCADTVNDVLLVASDDGWPHEAHQPITGHQAFLNVRENADKIVTTIDLIAAHFPPPDAVTMDVEGAEILVARGMQLTLAQHRPLVWVSVHAEAMFNDWGVYQVEFFSEFHSLGYEKTFLDFDHEAHWFFWPSERAGEVVLP